MKTEQLSFASISEAVEIEYNSFNSVIESTNILLNESLIKKDHFKDVGKAIIEKIKLLWTKIKRWIAAIKLKLINYCKNFIFPKVDKTIAAVEKASKENKISNIKSYEMAVLVTKKDGKKKVEITSAECKSKFDITRNIIKNFRELLHDMKFIVSEVDIKNLNKDELLNKIKDNIPEFEDSEEIAIDELNDISKTQEAIKDFVKDNLDDKKSFPILYCTIKANQSDNSFILNSYKVRLNQTKELVNELEKDYSNLLSKQKEFEKGYNKVISIFDAAKGNNSFIGLGSWLRDDINSIKFASSVICGFFVGLIKEVTFNALNLTSIFNGKSEVNKNAKDLSNEVKDKLDDLKDDMVKESKKTA